MDYISNAFSLQMLESADSTIPVYIKEVKELPRGFTKRLHSVVGHADTARILGVKFNRRSITLKPGDVLYVAQVVGGRLPEGSTTLPEGFKMKYFRVEIGWEL